MQGKPGAQKQPAVAAATVIQTHIVERLACANMEQVMRNRAVVFVPVVARFGRRMCRYSTAIGTGIVTTNYTYLRLRLVPIRFQAPVHSRGIAFTTPRFTASLAGMIVFGDGPSLPLNVHWDLMNEASIAIRCTTYL